MNLLIYHRREVEGGRLILPAGDRRREHIGLILKLRAGDRLRVGQLNGPECTARLLDDSTQPGPLALLLAPPQELAPTGPVRRVLILALPRPPVLRRVLELAPQLDVQRLILLRSARVEKSYFQSPLLSQGEWRRHLELGLEQARHTREPQVLVFQRFKPFVEDELARWLPPNGLRLLPHPGPWPSLASLARQEMASWSLAIGPEGGWVESESEAFVQQSFQPVSLGSRILRVESAVHRVVAQLDLLHELKSGA